LPSRRDAERKGFQVVGTEVGEHFLDVPISGCFYFLVVCIVSLLHWLGYGGFYELRSRDKQVGEAVDVASSRLRRLKLGDGRA